MRLIKLSGLNQRLWCRWKNSNNLLGHQYHSEKGVFGHNPISPELIPKLSSKF